MSASNSVPGNPAAWSWRWVIGMCLASILSLVYIITPIYLIACITSFFFLPLGSALMLCLPLIVSMVIPPVQLPGLVGLLTPILTYFPYEEVFELDNDEVRRRLKAGNRYLLAMSPHGVLSYCGVCAAIAAPPDLRANLKTAVSSSLFYTPIIKNVIGIFGLTVASKSNMKRRFRMGGLHGCLVLYVGGIAELFKTSRTEERLYLSRRKGFIKLALQEGVDVVPAYLFGNTSVLTPLSYGPLASLSRSLGVALTYFWGKWNLPIPRDDKMMYVRGKPLGMPQIADPSNDDINKWHKKFCQEMQRLFDENKEKVPLYKHKTLIID